jgi:hypothetical protein
MADYQRVVEFLRDLRGSGGGLPQQVTDQVVRAAEEFAALCVSANERLRQCSTFLQQGLRSEAIHLAEQPPNLLDLVAALDLPDPEAWAEYCQNNGLAVPPALQMDRATQLNEAYSHGAGMEELLAKHRRLALARGAVRDRLAVLRQIAAADGANGAGGLWEKDVRLFERARLKELPAAFHGAMKAKDEGRIRELMEEVHGAPWLEAVPGDLAAAVAEADARFRRAAAEGELKQIVDPLRDAFAARDVGMCRTLVGRWRAVIERTGAADVSAALVDEMKPVVAFLAEEEKKEAKRKRFKDATKGFGALLDRDAPEEELEPAWARLTAFEEEVPGELERRYREKRESRERAAVRAHRMKLAGAAAATLVLGGALVAAFLMYEHTQAARGWAGKIEQANKARDLGSADAYVEQLQKEHQGYLSDSSVVAAMRHTRGLHEEYTRQRGLVEQLVAAMTAAQQEAGKLLGNAEATDDQLAAAADSLQRAADQAKAAGDLSWGDAEGKLASANFNVKQMAEEARRKASAAALKEIGALGGRLEAIGPGGMNVPAARAELATVADRLATIRGWSALEADAQAAAAGLGQKLAERQQVFAQARNAAGAIEALRSETTSAVALGRALGEFLKRFPNDPRAADFAVAARNTAWGEAAEAWKRAWGDTGPVDPTTAGEAAKRMDLMASYLKDYPGSPLKAGLGAYGDYLKRFSAAVGENGAAGTWDATLGDFLTNPLLSQLQYMERSDGRRFYVMGDIKRTNFQTKDQKEKGEVTIIFQAMDAKDAAKRVPVLVDPPLKLLTEEPVDAPHTKMVKAFTQELKGIGAGNWDTWGVDAAERLRNAEALDIVVRGVLLQRILKAEVQVAGPEVGDVYGATLASLAKQKPDDVPWLDPAAVPEAVKKGLAAVLAAMPSGETVKAGIAQKKADILRPAAFDVAAVGMLLKDGEWTVITKGALPEKGVVYTVGPAEGGDGGAVAATGPSATPGAWLQVGTVAGGKAVLDAGALGRVPQGNVCYVLRP